jgi:DNA polymerase-3 subunit gamma/tau
MDLAKKYRSKKLNEILGNKTTIQILEGYIKSMSHPHSYLFYGERGLGKTTIARILCKEFNCDLIELNNSNNRGIDTVREVIYNGSKHKTWEGKNKGYLLDEVHKLTNDAQNALLKILEEPPNHVYFFLCTTEPEKLLKTVKSRCQQFQLEKIRGNELYPFLIEISEKEDNQIIKKIARKIAETSEGHVRDALFILQSVIQIRDNEEKQLKIAGQKIESERQIIDLCRSLLNRDGWETCREILKKLQNENPETVRKIVLAYMQRVILSKQHNKTAAIIIDMLRESTNDFAVLCANFFEIFC